MDNKNKNIAAGTKQCHREPSIFAYANNGFFYLRLLV